MENAPALHELCDELVRVLGAAVVGCYALSEPGRFVVVTANRLVGDAQETVREVHRGLRHSDVEGSYAPAADLRSPMTVGRTWPRVVRGSRELLPSAEDNTVHGRWVLRHEAQVVHGPVASSLVHEVGATSLRAEAVGIARARAEAIEEHPALLDDPAHRRDLVDKLCQVLHTARRARVLPRDAAVAWALDEVPELRPLLDDVRRLVWEVHRLVGVELVRPDGIRPDGIRPER